MISFTEFKKKYPVGSSVATQEGTWKGQCVSLVRQYMLQVHGFKSGPLGNAVDFASNPTFLKSYEKVKSPSVGDIMVWGDDPGTWTGSAGHIAIYNGSGRMYNQNYNGSLKVSINDTFTPGFIGYYRKKVVMTPQDKKDLALGRRARRGKWEDQVNMAKDLAERIAKTNQTDSWLKHLIKLAQGKR